MKRVLPKITAAVLMATAMTACSGKQDTSQVSGSVEVLAPMSDAKGEYSLKFIELSGLDNLREVSGRFVRFFMAPRILSDRLSGSAPQGRFIKNTDNQFVPANDLTQQLVTVYAHMQNLANLDEELGAGGVNHWPRDIGVAVRVVGGMNNNAFYDGKTDAMLFVPYTKAELPIAVNGGILAHEHFHSLFYKLVMKNNTDPTAQSPTGSIHDRTQFLKSVGVEDESNDKSVEVRIGTGEVPTPSENTVSERRVRSYYVNTYVRGLNEGLADFWGWMYTGNPDFIANSLPSEKQARTMSVDKETSLTLTESGQLRNASSLYNQYDKVNFDKFMLGLAYNIGTRYSRTLKRLTDISAESRGVESLAMRKEVAKWIIKALPVFKADFTTTSASGFYAPTQFIDNLVSVIPDLNQKECAFLADVINKTNADSKRTCQADAGHFKMVEAN